MARVSLFYPDCEARQGKKRDTDEWVSALSSPHGGFIAEPCTGTGAVL